MTFARKSGGANVALTTVKRREGGAWVNVQTVKRRSGGAWTTVWTAYTPVSATVSPTDASGTNADQQQPTILVETFGSPTVTASGGSGTITYAWERVSGSTAITAVSSTAASTKFSGTVPVNTSISAVFRCKVTDGTTTAYTDNVTVTLTHGLPP